MNNKCFRIVSPGKLQYTMVYRDNTIIHHSIKVVVYGNSLYNYFLSMRIASQRCISEIITKIYYSFKISSHTVLRFSLSEQIFNTDYLSMNAINIYIFRICISITYVLTFIIF